MAPIILMSFLLIVIAFTMFTQINTFSLPMIPLDSPHLQILPKSLSPQEHYQFLMNISMARASSYSKRRDSNLITNSIEATGHRMFSNYYVTQLFFGTGQLVSPYVLLDTGEERTWVQCDGCNPCFELKTGNIRASSSLSYKLLSLDDQRCNPKYDYHGWCGYSTTYVSGASSSGVMGTDTFLFMNPQTQKPDSFQDLAFGCGFMNKNFDFGPEDLTAGILGLFPSPQSFLTQLDSTIKGRFSYCLTSWGEPDPGMSTIHFGDSAQIEGPNVQKIPMNVNTHYHLYFGGISVDGKRLPIDPSMCSLDGQGGGYTKGFVIDSGSPFTMLPYSTFQLLRSAIIDYFATYGFQPIAKEDKTKLCYLTAFGGPTTFPSVVFHFAGNAKGGGEVDWVMDHNNMFTNSTNFDGFCIVVAPKPDSYPCLFGAYQQANFRILYDVKNALLYFSQERCQENRPLYDLSDMERYTQVGMHTT